MKQVSTLINHLCVFCSTKHGTITIMNGTNQIWKVQLRPNRDKKKEEAQKAIQVISRYSILFIFKFIDNDLLYI